MEIAKIFLKFFLLITIFLSLYVVFIYNYISLAVEKVKKNKNDVSIELDRRFKVFESLVNINFRTSEDKKHAIKEFYYINKSKEQHENFRNDKTLQHVDKKYLENTFSEMIFLQQEVIETENRLAEAKKKLNESICLYKCVKSYLLCDFLVSNMKPDLENNFLYWGLDKEEALEKENYSVHL